MEKFNILQIISLYFITKDLMKKLFILSLLFLSMPTMPSALAKATHSTYRYCRVPKRQKSPILHNLIRFLNGANSNSALNLKTQDLECPEVITALRDASSRGALVRMIVPMYNQSLDDETAVFATAKNVSSGYKNIAIAQPVWSRNKILRSRLGFQCLIESKNKRPKLCRSNAILTTDALEKNTARAIYTQDPKKVANWRKDFDREWKKLTSDK